MNSNNIETHEPQQENHHDNKDYTTNHDSSTPLECNICYEDSYEPVVTTCGHIYCWACIYQWLQSKPENNYCPVCKNVVTQDKLIPIYTKNESKTKRTRPDNIPKRPQNPREERQTNGNQTNNNFFTGISTGGLFNFLFYGLNINTRNVAIKIGFLPTLIPILIMFLFSLFGDSDDDEYYNQPQPKNTRRPAQRIRPNNIQQQVNAIDDTDFFENNMIIMFIVFIALTIFIRKIMS